jgi:hypothetical protein
VLRPQQSSRELRGGEHATVAGGAIPRKVMKGGSHLCAPNYSPAVPTAARQGETIDTSTGHNRLSLRRAPELVVQLHPGAAPIPETCGTSRSASEWALVKGRGGTDKWLVP